MRSSIESYVSSPQTPIKNAWRRCSPGWGALAVLVLLARAALAMVSALIALVLDGLAGRDDQ
jgi:hypothetical protein